MRSVVATLGSRTPSTRWRTVSRKRRLSDCLITRSPDTPYALTPSALDDSLAPPGQLARGEGGVRRADDRYGAGAGAGISLHHLCRSAVSPGLPAAPRRGRSCPCVAVAVADCGS